METVTAQVGAGMLKGSAKASFDTADDQWWHTGLASALANGKSKKEKKKKSKKNKNKEGRQEENAEEEASPAPLIMDDLFRATGGARLGMRARFAQPGKLQRAESGARDDGTATTTATEPKPPAADTGCAPKKRKHSGQDISASGDIANRFTVHRMSGEEQCRYHRNRERVCLRCESLAHEQHQDAC